MKLQEASHFKSSNHLMQEIYYLEYYLRKRPSFIGYALKKSKRKELKDLRSKKSGHDFLKISRTVSAVFKSRIFTLPKGPVDISVLPL